MILHIEQKEKYMILVIEDEEVIRLIYRNHIESFGYSVICAENGKIGLDLFRKHQQQIKIIIIDMIMPVLNGLDTLRLIRDISPLIPVIISSGFIKHEIRKELQILGVHNILSKPFQKEELLKTLKKIIND